MSINLSVIVNHSNQHIHLSKEDAIELMVDYPLEVDANKKELFLSGNWASSLRLTKGDYGFRVLMPYRAKSQCEIDVTMAEKLGIPAVYSNSGELDGLPTLDFYGVKIPTFIPYPHVHIHALDAKANGITAKDHAICDINGNLFELRVKIHDSFQYFKPQVHLDKALSKSLNRPSEGKIVGTV